MLRAEHLQILGFIAASGPNGLDVVALKLKFRTAHGTGGWVAPLAALIAAMHESCGVHGDVTAMSRLRYHVYMDPSGQAGIEI